MPIHNGEEEEVALSSWVLLVPSDNGVGVGIFQGIVRRKGRSSVLPNDSSGSVVRGGCSVLVKPGLQHLQWEEGKGAGLHLGFAVGSPGANCNFKCLRLSVLVVDVCRATNCYYCSQWSPAATEHAHFRSELGLDDTVQLSMVYFNFI